MGQAAHVIAGLGLCGGLGCGLVLGLDEPHPCIHDSDCVYSAGPGVCVNSVCRPAEEVAGDTTAAVPEEDETSSGAETTGGAAESGGSESADVAVCARNSECGAEQRCGDDGLCTDLLSSECQSVAYPDDDRDDVVFVGTILPLSDPFLGSMEPLQNAALLAIEDFNQKTTLQGDRRIAWVGCDSSAGADAAVAAATHLVENVGVPAIIGPARSESVLAVVEDIALEAGVFVMTPTASAISLTDVDDGGLLWRTAASDVYQVHAIRDRLVDLADDPLPMARILVLAKGDLAGMDMRTVLQPSLESALPGTEITFRSYEDPAVFGGSVDEMLSSYGGVIADAFTDLGAPGAYTDPEDHFTDVVVLGTAEAQRLLYAYLNAWELWQTPPAPDPPIPRFTFSEGAVDAMPRYVDDIGAIEGTGPFVPLRSEILASLQGVSPDAVHEGNFAALNVRYRVRFGEDAAPESARGYDATMATLLAMCTVAADEAVTGSAIAGAMPRLSDAAGTAVQMAGQTLAFVTQARNALVTDGGAVDLQGVSGELAWDDAGDVRVDSVGWELVDSGGTALSAARAYVLDPPPALDGVWTEL